jgi:TonB family protein
LVGKILTGSSLTGLMLLMLIPVIAIASDHGETDLHPWLEQPVCTWIPPLQYPAAVKDKSLSGNVIVLVTVDGKGEFRDTELLKSELPELFIVEALKAVRRSRFKSRRLDGNGVQSSLVLTFHFDPLADPPPPEEPVDEPVATEAATTDTEPGQETVTMADVEPYPAGLSTEPDPVQMDTSSETEMVTEPETEETEAITEAGTETPTEVVVDDNGVDEAVETGPDKVIDEVEERSPGVESRLSMRSAAFGTGVSARQIVGVGDSFELGGKVYFLTRIDGGSEGMIIKHVWKWGERVIQSLELTLKGSSWRTWSYKTMYPGMTGEWSVDVLDGEDNLLGSHNFTCIPAVDANLSDEPDSSGDPDNSDEIPPANDIPAASDTHTSDEAAPGR